MSDFDIPKSDFEKGAYVFGRCQNELPWPAKIIKITKDRYTVKFINHRSTAVLTEDCLTLFNQRSCAEVIDEYKDDKSFDKVKVAIRACRNEIQNIKKKQEKEYVKNIKNEKTKSTKNEKAEKTEKTEISQPAEASQNNQTRHKQKKPKQLKKLSKNHDAQELNIPESKFSEKEDLDRYKVFVPSASQDSSDVIKNLIKNVNCEIKENDLNIAYMSEEDEKPLKRKPDQPVQAIQPVQIVLPIQQLEKNEEIESIPILEVAKQVQSIVQSAIKKIEEEETNHMQPTMQKMQEQVISTEFDRLTASKYFSESNASYVQSNIASQNEYIPTQSNHQHLVRSACPSSMQVENDSRPNYSEVDEEQAERKRINSLIHILNKMINYFSGDESAAPSKEEKKDFGLLLKNYRKFYYDYVLLETMITFLKVFDFKKKELRKTCIIEYVKIKERVETICFLRQRLFYDERTHEILDKYAPRPLNN